MSEAPKKRALGRGLDALLPMNPRPAPPASGAAASDSKSGMFVCPIEKIVPQKGQPRQVFPQLDELAASIREHGLLEPLVVRRIGGDKFELIAGERRWRAAQKAGLTDLPVVVKDVTPEKAFVLAILENVQREDLNPVELAEAYDRLLKEHGFTQETLAAQVGKDRTTIANALRLLKLPARVREKVINGELSEGHARALLGAQTGLEQLAEKVLRGKLSVRATEELVRKARSAKEDPKPEAAAGQGGTSSKSPAVRDLETRLMRALGTKCEVRDRGNKGEIAIPYTDLAQLDRILAKLMR
jgi:ParB family transcriptional regulator, chromosome partitioning protein